MSWGEINDVSESIALRIKNKRKHDNLLVYAAASLNRTAILSSFDKSIKFPSYNKVFADVEKNADDSMDIKAVMEAKAARIKAVKGGE